MTKTIKEFQGEYRFLSNFYPYPVEIEGIKYPARENAYMAQKTLDLSIRKHLATIEKPGEAKRYGRKIKLRSDWEEVKFQCMSKVVWACLKQNPEFQKKLLATEDAILIEGNHWNDTYWGMCNGIGQNNLGKILMTCRKRLQFELLPDSENFEDVPDENDIG